MHLGHLSVDLYYHIRFEEWMYFILLHERTRYIARHSHKKCVSSCWKSCTVDAIRGHATTFMGAIVLRVVVGIA